MGVKKGEKESWNRMPISPPPFYFKRQFPFFRPQSTLKEPKEALKIKGTRGEERRGDSLKIFLDR